MTCRRHVPPPQEAAWTAVETTLHDRGPMRRVAASDRPCIGSSCVSWSSSGVDLQHRGVRGHGGLGVVAGGDVQELGDRGRAAPGELDVAVTDLVRLLGRPSIDLRTAGKRALT